MESNPYNSPSANLFGSSSQTTTEAVPSEAITQLQRTKPWVRFFGVMMWLGSALMLLGGAAFLLIALSGLASSAAAGMPKEMMVGLAVAYILMGFLYIYPTIKIWAYGSAIGRLVTSRSADDLVKALDMQRGFWKFIGIMLIILMVMYFLFFVAMFVAGAAGALKNMPMPQ